MVTTYEIACDRTIIKQLIDSVFNYGLRFNWCDGDIIGTLLDCGITREDFIQCGYESIVEQYFN